MRRFINMLIAILLLSTLFGAIYCGGSVSIDVLGCHYTISLSYFIIGLILIVLLKITYTKTSKLILSLFTKDEKKDILNGVMSIQSALSYILLKDPDMAEKSIEQAKNAIGNCSMLNWLEGNVSLLRNDTHHAKSMFYYTSANEVKSFLGAYSLCRLAIQNGDKNTEIETLESMLHICSNKRLILERLIAISLQKNDFESANKNLQTLKANGKYKRLEAIVKYSEAMSNNCTDIEDLLCDAFQLAPEITWISISYANELIAKSEISKARNVLMTSWKLSPNPKIFDLYVKCGNEDNAIERLDLSEKLVKNCTNSWIGYFEYAKILIENGKNEDAFYNLLSAYGKCKFKNVLDLLRITAESISDPKPSSAQEVLNNKQDSIDGNMQWICSNCGYVHNSWHAICVKCESIDTIEWTNSVSVNNLCYKDNILI